jgi:hypothetical protein
MLSLKTRREIQKHFDAGLTVIETAKVMKMQRSTLHREKNKCEDRYDAEEAHANTCKGYHPIDLSIIGKKIHKLTVVELVGFNNNSRRRTTWKCECECGEICYFSRKMLTEYCSPDRPLSCGCIDKEHAGENGTVPIEEAALRKYQDLLSFRKMNGSCWNWTGYRQKGKLPKTSWKNKGMSVRKCMYLLMNGTTYEPNPVFTTCGNLLCFNPEHITLLRPLKRQFYEDHI